METEVPEKALMVCACVVKPRLVSRDFDCIRKLRGKLGQILMAYNMQRSFHCHYRITAHKKVHKSCCCHLFRVMLSHDQHRSPLCYSTWQTTIFLMCISKCHRRLLVSFHSLQTLNCSNFSHLGSLLLKQLTRPPASSNGHKIKFKHFPLCSFN